MLFLQKKKKGTFLLKYDFVLHNATVGIFLILFTYCLQRTILSCYRVHWSPIKCHNTHFLTIAFRWTVIFNYRSVISYHLLYNLYESCWYIFLLLFAHKYFYLVEVTVCVCFYTCIVVWTLTAHYKRIFVCSYMIFKTAILQCCSLCCTDQRRL